MRTANRHPYAGPLDEDRTPTGINVAVGAAAVVATAVLAAFLPAGHLWWRLDVMVALVAGFGAVTGDQVALGGVALMVWLVSNGFFENHQGELSWHGSTDLGLAMVLVVAAAVGLAVGQVSRPSLIWRRRYTVTDDGSAPAADVEEKESRDG